MELVSSREPEHGAASSAAPPALTVIGPIELMLAKGMSASELTYFFGAPLAHVVEYENRLRAARSEKVVRAVARSCRTLHLHTCAAALSPGDDDQGSIANDA